jgi:hypothetical protein
MWLLVLLAQVQTLPELEAGLTLRVYAVEGPLAELPALAPDQTPNEDRVVPTADLSAGELGALPAPIVTSLSGWIEVAAAGERVFRLTSDDGARLSIDGTEVLAHDGLHGATARESEPLLLAAGKHSLLVEHFDQGGARALKLEWRGPGEDAFRVPGAGELFTELDRTRVTAPGTKRLASSGRPGDGLPLEGVHPGYRVESIRPLGFEPKVGSLAFLPDGRLAIGTLDPLQRDDVSLPDIESKTPDRIFALDLAARTVTEIAGGVFEPMGMCVVDGALYVAQRREITRLDDRDGDGWLETHTTVAAGWEGWNYHQFTMGLVHRDGLLYTALSTAMAPPGWEGMHTNAGPNGPMRGGFLEVDLSSGDVRVIAGGARSPNGLGLASDGALLYADNQGAWMPTSVLAEVLPGRFYGHYNWTAPVTKLLERFPLGGHPSVYCDRPRTPPALWLPQDEVVNSPTEIVAIPSGPYAGQILIGELTAGGLRRAALERVDGVLQGALFRFSQGFECGINRLRFGADGALVVGGIGAEGNWRWRETRFGLERLVPTGETAFEILDVKATPRGFRLRFTDDLALDWLSDPSHYEVESWSYAPTADYGGPKVGPRRHAVSVSDAEPRAATLELAGLETGRCFHLRLVEPRSLAGLPMWSPECWYTLNRLPAATPAPVAVGLGLLPPPEAVTLVASAFPMTMRFAGAPDTPAAFTQDDLLAASPWVEVGEGSGDLVSTTVFADARIHIEWWCPPGGAGQRAANSGVHLQDRYELQVLGSPPAPHAPALDEAGALYGRRAPDVNASAGPGAWQAYDVWFHAPRFRAGRKVADARVSVWWNGELVHDDVELAGPTGSAVAKGEEPGPNGCVQLGPLRLQDHESDAEGAVRYRNVWIAPLDAAEPRPGPWIELLAQGEWAPRGGAAEFALEGGTLTGTSRPRTPNTFWTSRETFGDFELLFDVRVDAELNSGVQIRSQVEGGFERRDGALVGLQVEIDPGARAYSAGLYDERRRGWLHPLGSAPYARRAFETDEWNHFRVVARGPAVRTWINGVPAAEILDAMDTEGHIGFQVHGVGEREPPLRVEWRAVRLRRL